MKQGFRGSAFVVGLAACLALLPGAAAAAENAALKAEVAKAVEARGKLAQQMTDSIFSFGEAVSNSFIRSCPAGRSAVRW